MSMVGARQLSMPFPGHWCQCCTELRFVCWHHDWAAHQWMLCPSCDRMYFVRIHIEID